VVAFVVGGIGVILLAITYPASAGEPEAGQPDGPPLPDWARVCQVVGVIAIVVAAAVGVMAVVLHRRAPAEQLG
jgi:hypothetical protein